MATLQSDDQTQFEVKTMGVFWQDQECFMHILSDVTELHQAQRDRARAHFQRMMMNNVSHEYKTPLNAIISSTQLTMAKLAALGEQVGSGLKQKVFELMRQVEVESTSSELMLCLVNGMIDMGHMQVRRIQLRVETFALPDLAATLRSLFKLQASQRRLRFDFRVDKSLTVRGD